MKMQTMLLFQYLKTLKEKILSFEFIEPVSVDDEDTIVEDEAKAGPDDEKLPAVLVRPGPSKQGVHYGRYCLCTFFSI